jgi:LacI family transcriptional regulator
VAAKRASITDLARELNVSVSTVSRALNDSPTISVAMKQRIAALAQERNYQPNRLAAGLRKGRSKMLGVLVPHIEGAFFAAVVHGIETAATRAGFNVMICQSNEDVQHERQNIETLINAQVEGILVSLSRTTHDFKHFEKVRKHEIPLVFFDRILEGTDVSAVVIDDYQGAYQVVSHLIEQGCTRIAHFAGPQHLNIYKNRLLGYLSALQVHGLHVNEQLIITSDMKLADGVAGMTQLLTLPPAIRPDAVFSASDFSMLGALQTLKEHGLRAPHDMALAGFSNELFTAYTEPPLTSVDQRCEQMGQSAVRLFLDMLDAPTASLQTSRVVLQPSMLVRQSSVRRKG